MNPLRPGRRAAATVTLAVIAACAVLVAGWLAMATLTVAISVVAVQR